jgi:hypothetical protein
MNVRKLKATMMMTMRRLRLHQKERGQTNMIQMTMMEEKMA